MNRSFFFVFSAIILLFACHPPAPAKEEITGKQEEWALLPFEKVDSVNPVMEPSNRRFFCPILKDSVSWESKDVFNPAGIVRNDSLFLLYRAEDTIGRFAGTSRIGLAVSTDGLHFYRYPTPVLYPDNDSLKKYEWEGGCEDPRLVQSPDGNYIMTYTSYDGQVARMMVASSPDLFHWQKHGPVFSKAYGGRYVNKWSKSGSIVSTYENGKIVATKINGKYWMYWGDVNIWAATSDNLIDWTPVLYEGGEKPTIELRRNAGEIAEVKIVFGPRKGKFDSDLVEPGPPAMITKDGILLLYNSRNIPSIGDTSLAEGTYAASQILMDRNDPIKVIKRMDRYFMKPDKPYETTGQVNHVCFIEALMKFRDRWYLYYGTADSKIAVAVK